MRPRVICHMVSTIDGKTNPRPTGLPISAEYEKTGKELAGDAWLCGRVTMQKDFADYQDEGQFRPVSDAPAGARKPHVAAKTGAYAISADTNGVVSWNTNDLDGDHLICLVSEKVSADYLTHLEKHRISYVVAGVEKIDFARGLELLKEHFEIDTVLLEGGGHVNGGVLDADCVDEVSLLVAPGIDGHGGVATIFDGRKEQNHVRLSLTSMERREHGILWLRYDIVR